MKFSLLKTSKNYFYKSNEWQTVRKQCILDRLINDETICEHCGKVISLKAEVIGHHKIHLTEANVNDYMISLNPENIELICLDCHNKEHKRFGYETKRNVLIVWGSPGAGKTTYALNNMTNEDLIIDIDLIYKAFNPIVTTKPKHIASIVLDIWYELISREGAIAIRKGSWQTCYIVGCFPSKQTREELAKNLNANLIHINTSKEECKARILADPKRQINLDQQIEWLKEYWDELIE